MHGSAPVRAVERICIVVASDRDVRAIERVVDPGSNDDTSRAFLVAPDLGLRASTIDTLQLRFPARVVRVDGTMPLSSGMVYVARRGRRLVLSGTSISSEENTAEHHLGELLSTVAASWGERAILVVLAGRMSPVESGARAVLESGGSVYCLSPSKSSNGVLPSAMLRTMGASGVGSVDEIWTWIRGGLASGVRDTGEPERVDIPLPASFWSLLESVRIRSDLDWYAYRTATLYRRMLQRARSRGFSGIDEYAAQARSDDDELDTLGSRLLIGTTEFFRDDALFDDLRGVVVPAVYDRPTFAVWCGGCSTGEEAYSVAATLHSELEAQGSSTRLRVVATDVRPDAVRVATEGRYPIGRLETMPAQVRTRYGTESNGVWTVGDTLRDCVRFGIHDILGEPPPDGRDLILLRNVMIYLRPEVHIRILRSVHRALRPGGFLGLGESESTHALDGAFRPLRDHGSILQRVTHWSGSAADPTR